MGLFWSAMGWMSRPREEDTSSCATSGAQHSRSGATLGSRLPTPRSTASTRTSCPSADDEFSERPGQPAMTRSRERGCDRHWPSARKNTHGSSRRGTGSIASGCEPWLATHEYRRNFNSDLVLWSRKLPAKWPATFRSPRMGKPIIEPCRLGPGRVRHTTSRRRTPGQCRPMQRGALSYPEKWESASGDAVSLVMPTTSGMTWLSQPTLFG